MASMARFMEGPPFWCHGCTRLHQTCAGAAAVSAACPVCAPVPEPYVESIVEVVDERTFLQGGQPEDLPAGAHGHAEPLPLVTVRDAGLTCPVCLDELEPGAVATETPCQHAYHPACLATWFKDRSTCPVCRCKFAAAEDAAGSPDGLILCDLQNGRFALGRRTAGHCLRMVGILDEVGMLVRHPCPPLDRGRRFGLLRWFRARRARQGSRA
ncbi:hypothetical protein ZWY2020_019113 [Hordeum vulgare]|nr:hypothetical protein ZWY2020_019113 [Hordeum vulgare]